MSDKPPLLRLAESRLTSQLPLLFHRSRTPALKISLRFGLGIAPALDGVLFDPLAVWSFDVEHGNVSDLHLVAGRSQRFVSGVVGVESDFRGLIFVLRVCSFHMMALRSRFADTMADITKFWRLYGTAVSD